MPRLEELYELETLNEHLNNELEKLKEQLEERDSQILKMRQAVDEYFDKFVQLNMPFGQKGDTKIIEIIVLKDTYEKEILPYNRMQQIMLEAEKNAKPIEKAPKEIQEIHQEKIQNIEKNKNKKNNDDDDDNDK